MTEQHRGQIRDTMSDRASRTPDAQRKRAGEDRAGAGLAEELLEIGEAQDVRADRGRNTSGRVQLNG